MNGMDFIENRIKLLVERSTAFLPWTEKSDEIMSSLNHSIQQTLLLNESERPPSQFSIKMNSENAQAWLKNTSWQSDLENAYAAILTEYGIKQEFQPVFTLVVKNSLGSKQIEIVETGTPVTEKETHSITSANASNKVPVEAKGHFPILLFGEEKEIPLTTPVITIGRREDNDIVIEDIRISRTHAQIRKTPRGVIVFDAGSSGGTYVNGTRITQQALRSGDVISLGGYKFIYLNEDASPDAPGMVNSNPETEGIPSC